MMTLGNQISLYESHIAYSIIRKADYSYRGVRTTYNRLIKELALLFSTPSAVVLKHLLRYINARTKHRIEEIKNIEVTKSNFLVLRNLHEKLSKLTAESRLYNLNQVPNNLISTVKEINNFMISMTEYERVLKLKLYPSNYQGASIEEVLEQRKKLEAFAEDWDDDEDGVYDTAFLTK